MTESERRPWASLPLAAAYVAFPLLMVAVRLGGMPLSRNWIDGLWALWTLGCLLAVLNRAGLGGRDASRTPALRAHSLSLAMPLAALLLTLAVLLRFGPGLAHDWTEPVPWLMELKPFFYLTVAGLTAAATGLPGSRAFPRFAAALSVLLLAELALASLAAGEITRPQGSGEINYDATLLLLGLCLGLNERVPGLKALILAGIAASMSRTTLLSAGLVVLICWPGLSLARRLTLSLSLMVCIGLAFTLRGLSWDSLEELDRYWMWRSAVTLMAEHPAQAVTGFAPGIPLPVDTPGALWALWADQAQAVEAPGVHAYNYHAFWLRLAVSWGLPGVLAVLVPTVGLLRRGPRSRALGLVILVQGLTLGLFYLSNVAPVLLLAWWRVRREGSFLACVHEEPPPPRGAGEETAGARDDRPCSCPGGAHGVLGLQGVDA